MEDPNIQREAFAFAMSAAVKAADQAYTDGYREAKARQWEDDDARDKASDASRRAAWTELQDQGIGGGTRDILAAVAALEATITRTARITL